MAGRTGGLCVQLEHAVPVSFGDLRGMNRHIADEDAAFTCRINHDAQMPGRVPRGMQGAQFTGQRMVAVDQFQYVECLEWRDSLVDLGEGEVSLDLGALERLPVDAVDEVAGPWEGRVSP